LLFKSLSWTGGFLDGETIRFADDLTAFIGGRGTGKSTAIESLRYVLGVEPIGEGARRDHSTVVSDVLERGTIVELIVDAVSPVAGRYTIRRTVPDPAVVLDASDSVTDLKPLDVTGSVEIFGQHELAEVAEQPSNVARLISRFSEEALTVNLAGLQDRLRDNRTRLSGVEQEQDRLEEELADIPRLQSTVAQFESADWPNRLAEQRRLTQDQAVVHEGLKRVDDAASAVAELAEMDLVGTLREAYEALAEPGSTDVVW
jgi:DNA repair ATPase RecN